MEQIIESPGKLPGFSIWETGLKDIFNGIKQESSSRMLN